VFAQVTQVRVLKDRTTIWRPGFYVAAGIVDAGTVLEVVSREGHWYRVVVPFGNGVEGLISDVAVEPVTGAPVPTGPSSTDRPPVAPPAKAQARAITRKPSVSREPLARVRGIGQVGLAWFEAQRSFDAIFGQEQGIWFGGGADVRFRGGLFVQGTVDWFNKTGERVFVFEDQIFQLGISETVTIVPVAISGGYRFGRRSVVPYAGGGVGTYIYRESAEFDESSERLEQNPISYHAFGGVELPIGRMAAIAIEAHQAWVPDALSGGTAAVFNESDLGGLGFRVKFLFGR